MKQSILILFLALGISSSLYSQDYYNYTYRTFKDQRVINSQSVEVLEARRLQIRISHRFGDIGGDAGGWGTFYGLEFAEDVAIGADYGITDKLDVSFFRTKGAGPLKQVLNGGLKYQFLRQQPSSGSPVTITAYGLASLSTMERSEAPESLSSFPDFQHRLVYHLEVMVARKFSEAFSLQLSPGYTHRNLVQSDDENGIFSISAATRIQLSKVFSIIAEGTVPVTSFADGDYQLPLGLGLEIDTGGHVFQINFTNASGLAPTDYIPYTNSRWGNGEFRFGFTVARLFNL